jgi:O-antigen/teichoic acid export membrane protein
MSDAPPPGPAPVTSRDVAKGAGTTLLARLGALLEVIAQPLYVWMFGLATFGLYAVLWAAVNLAENVADLGMTSSMQRVVPQTKSEQEAVSALRSAIVLGVGPCILVALAASVGAPVIAPLFNSSEADAAHLVEVIRLFAWALPLWAFVEIATSALRAKRVFGAEIRLRVFWEQLVRLVIAIALWFGGVSTMALFYAHLASLTIICALCVRLLARYFDLRLFFKGRLVDRVFHDSWQAGLAVLPANVVARLLGDGPPLALNWILPGAAGAVAGGLFSIARKVSSIVQLVRIAFAYVLAPLASHASQGHESEVQTIYGFATRVSLAVATPVGMVLAAASAPILAVFGTDAAMALPAMVVLVLARVIEAILGAAVPIQQVTSRYRHQLLASAVGLGAAALCALLLMPDGGLTGMAISVSIGFIIAAALPVVQLWQHDGLHPFASPFGRVLGIVLIVSAVALIVAEGWLFLPLWLQLPLMLATMLAALWASCRFALPLDDRQALGKTGRALRLS